MKISNSCHDEAVMKNSAGVMRRNRAVVDKGATVVRITHPHHPLAGTLVEVIRHRRGLRLGLIVRLPDGTSAGLSMEWVEPVQSEKVVEAEGQESELDVEGLRKMARVVGRLKS